MLAKKTREYLLIKHDDDDRDNTNVMTPDQKND
jgi:hypothetical protein